jgi:hypothetical protein
MVSNSSGLGIQNTHFDISFEFVLNIFISFNVNHIDEINKLINKIPTNAHMFYYTLTRLHVLSHEGHHHCFVCTEYQDFNGHQSKLHSLCVHVK